MTLYSNNEPIDTPSGAITIINNLASVDTDAALSAAQGKVLFDDQIASATRVNDDLELIKNDGTKIIAADVWSGRKGRLMGFASTFAGLPVADVDSVAIAESDFAILTTDDGANKAGYYVYDGTAYVFEKGFSQAQIIDADEDTMIQVESSPDSDVVNITIGGSASALFDSDGFEIQEGVLRMPEGSDRPAAEAGKVKIFARPATGDGIDQFTKLLLHANEPAGTSTPIDSSGLAKTAAVTGGVQTIDTDGAFGISSIEFDGSGQLDFGADPDFRAQNGVNLTLDAWINPDAVTGVQTIWASVRNANNYTRLILDGALLKLQFQRSGGAIEADLASTSNIAAGAWTHVAFERIDEGADYTFNLYVNGALEATVGGITGAEVNPTIGQFIGANQGAEFFAGKMDEFRVSREVARYQGAFTPNTAPYGSGLFYLSSTGNLTELASVSLGSTAGLQQEFSDADFNDTNDTETIVEQSHNAFDTSTAAFGLVVPQGTMEGMSFTMRDTGGSASSNPLTLTFSGGDTLEGATTFDLDKDNGVWFFFYDSETQKWNVLGKTEENLSTVKLLNSSAGNITELLPAAEAGTKIEFVIQDNTNEINILPDLAGGARLKGSASSEYFDVSALQVGDRFSVVTTQDDFWEISFAQISSADLFDKAVNDWDRTNLICEPPQLGELTGGRHSVLLERVSSGYGRYQIEDYGDVNINEPDDKTIRISFLAQNGYGPVVFGFGAVGPGADASLVSLSPIETGASYGVISVGVGSTPIVHHFNSSGGVIDMLVTFPKYTGMNRFGIMPGFVDTLDMTTIDDTVLGTAYLADIDLYAIKPGETGSSLENELATAASNNVNLENGKRIRIDGTSGVIGQDTVTLPTNPAIGDGGEFYNGTNFGLVLVKDAGDNYLGDPSTEISRHSAISWVCTAANEIAVVGTGAPYISPSLYSQYTSNGSSPNNSVTVTTTTVGSGYETVVMTDTDYELDDPFGLANITDRTFTIPESGKYKVSYSGSVNSGDGFLAAYNNGTRFWAGPSSAATDETATLKKIMTLAAGDVLEFGTFNTNGSTLKNINIVIEKYVDGTAIPAGDMPTQPIGGWADGDLAVWNTANGRLEAMSNPINIYTVPAATVVGYVDLTNTGIGNSAGNVNITEDAIVEEITMPSGLTKVTFHGRFSYYHEDGDVEFDFPAGFMGTIVNVSAQREQGEDYTAVMGIRKSGDDKVIFERDDGVDIDHRVSFQVVGYKA